MAAINKPVPMTALGLGGAGLMPFLILTLAPLWIPEYTDLCQRALALYSLGILCFLCGSWWGIGVMRNSTLPLLLGNALTLVAIFSCLLLATRHYFLVALALFLVLVWLEGRIAAFAAQPQYYRNLRLSLSVVAAICLGIASVTAV